MYSSTKNSTTIDQRDLHVARHPLAPLLRWRVGRRRRSAKPENRMSDRKEQRVRRRPFSSVALRPAFHPLAVVHQRHAPTSNPRVTAFSASPTCQARSHYARGAPHDTWRSKLTGTAERRRDPARDDRGDGGRRHRARGPERGADRRHLGAADDRLVHGRRLLHHVVAHTRYAVPQEPGALPRRRHPSRCSCWARSSSSVSSTCSSRHS